MKIQLKRSNVLESGVAKTPSADQLEYGEIAINYNDSDPSIFMKDSTNNVIRISGENAVGMGQTQVPIVATAPSNPVAGNQYFDTDDSRLYVYTGSAWVRVEPLLTTIADLDVTNTLDISGTANFTSNVGFGVASPSHALDISNASNAYIRQTQSNSTLRLGPAGTAASDGAFIGTDTTGPLRFYTNGSSNERLRIDTEGRVGINEISPVGILHVKEGESGVTPNTTHDTLFIENNDNAGITIGSPNDKSGYLAFADPQDNDVAKIQYFHTDNQLSFTINAGVKAVINSTGNFGIGTESPSQKLTVKGTAAYEATNSTNAWLGYTYTDNTFRLNYNGAGADEVVIDSSGRFGIGNTVMSSFTGNSSDNLVVGSGSGGEGITVYSAANNQGSITFADGTQGDAAYRGALEYSHTVDRFAFRTAGTGNRMVIDSSGNVGIGETDPSANLVVKQSGSTFTAQSQTVALFQRSSTTGHGAKIAIVSGNAASSDINFGDTDDEDAGLIQYVHTNNSFKFCTASNTTSRLTIDSSGNITIPGNLTVNGSFSQPSGDSSVLNSASVLQVGTTGNFDLELLSNNNKSIVVKNTGLVGIATDSPGKKLSIQDSSTPSLGLYTGSTLRAEFNATSAETSILSYANSPITFNVGGSANVEAIHINSSGKVGLGCTPVRDLQIHASDASSELMISNSTTGSSAGEGFMIQQDGNDTYIWNRENSFISFGTDSTDRLKLGSTGNLEFTSTSSSAQQELLFSDGTSGRGRIIYRHDGDSLAFETLSTGAGTNEAMRIDSSGNVLVGKASSTGLSAGCELRPAGFGVFTRASANPLQIRRLTNDGDLVEFYKDSGLIGSIGVDGTSLTVDMAGSEKIKITSDGTVQTSSYFQSTRSSGANSVLAGFHNSSLGVNIRANGNAEFQGEVVIGGSTARANSTCTINDDGYIFINRSSGNALIVQQDGDETSSDNKIALGTDGSATFGPTTGSYVQLAQNTGVTINDGAIDLYQATSTVTAKPFKVQSDVGGTKVEKVVILADGSVGIGKTSSLAAKLHIQDDSATETTLVKLRNYKTGVNTQAGLMFECSTSGSQGGNSLIKGVCGTDAGGSNSQNDGGLAFQTSSGGAGTLATRLLITSTGNAEFGGDVSVGNVSQAVVKNSGIFLKDTGNASASNFNIKLDTNGSATFNGFVDFIRNAGDGFAYMAIGPGGSNEKAAFVNRNEEIDFELYSDFSGSPTVSINSNGSATFASTITAGTETTTGTNIYASGSAQGIVGGTQKWYLAPTGSATFAGTIDHIAFNTGSNDAAAKGISAYNSGQLIIQGSSGVTSGTQTSLAVYYGNTEKFGVKNDGSATFTGNIQATNPRSSTASATTGGLCINPSDSTMYYNFRVDQVDNQLRIDTSQGADKIKLSYDGSGTFSGNISANDGVGADGGSTLSTGIYYRDDSNSYGLALYSGGSLQTNRKVFIKTDGSATFDGLVQVTRALATQTAFASFLGEGTDSTFKVTANGTGTFMGNVGIGTTNPGKDLEVYKDSIPTIKLNDGGDYQAYMQLAGNDLEIRSSSGALEFYTGAADGASSSKRLTITSTGNVEFNGQIFADSATGSLQMSRTSADGHTIRAGISGLSTYPFHVRARGTTDIHHLYNYRDDAALKVGYYTNGDNTTQRTAAFFTAKGALYLGDNGATTTSNFKTKLLPTGSATFINRCDFGSSSVADVAGKFTNSDLASATLYITNHNASGDVFSGRDSNNVEFSRIGTDGSADFAGDVKVTGAKEAYKSNGTFTLANDATTTFNIGYAAFFVITVTNCSEVTNGTSGAFFANTASSTIAEISDPFGDFTANNNVATTTGVTKTTNSNLITIRNDYGQSATYCVAIFGTST